MGRSNNPGLWQRTERSAECLAKVVLDLLVRQAGKSDMQDHRGGRLIAEGHRRRSDLRERHIDPLLRARLDDLGP